MGDRGGLMKKLTVMAAMICLLLGSLLATDDLYLIDTSRSAVGLFRIGMTRAEVEKAAINYPGKLKESENWGEGGSSWPILELSGIRGKSMIYFTFDNEENNQISRNARVNEITVFDRQFKTKNGVMVGMALSAVRKLLGAGNYYIYEDSTGGLEFDRFPQLSLRLEKDLWQLYPNGYPKGYGDNGKYSLDLLPGDDRVASISVHMAPESSVSAKEEMRRSPEFVNFRSNYKTLSVADGRAMEKRYDFFDKTDNPAARGIRHQYKVRTLVVIDQTTGLMWHQSGSDRTLPYEEAKAWLAELNKQGYAGYSDWRLPTLEEAASLVEPFAKNGALYIDKVFSNRQLRIWTGDLFSDSAAWAARFDFGDLNYYRHNVGNHIRPVRKGN
jgi:hypothetical protein